MQSLFLLVTGVSLLILFTYFVFTVYTNKSKFKTVHYLLLLITFVGGLLDLVAAFSTLFPQWSFLNYDQIRDIKILITIPLLIFFSTMFIIPKASNALRITIVSGSFIMIFSGFFNIVGRNQFNMLLFLLGLVTYLCILVIWLVKGVINSNEKIGIYILIFNFLTLSIYPLSTIWYQSHIFTYDLNSRIVFYSMLDLVVRGIFVYFLIQYILLNSTFEELEGKLKG